MPACSIPILVEIELLDPLPERPLILGESFQVRIRFTTDGSGASCLQSMNFIIERDEDGIPSSFDSQVPAAENTWYTTSHTVTQTGAYTVSANVVYVDVEPPEPPGSLLILNAASPLAIVVRHRLQVQSVHDERRPNATHDEGDVQASSDSGAKTATREEGDMKARVDSGAITATQDVGDKRASSHRGSMSSVHEQGDVRASSDSGSVTATHEQSTQTALGERGSKTATLGD